MGNDINVGGADFLEREPQLNKRAPQKHYGTFLDTQISAHKKQESAHKKQELADARTIITSVFEQVEKRREQLGEQTNAPSLLNKSAILKLASQIVEPGKGRDEAIQNFAIQQNLNPEQLLKTLNRIWDMNLNKKYDALLAKVTDLIKVDSRSEKLKGQQTKLGELKSQLDIINQSTKYDPETVTAARATARKLERKIAIALGVVRK